MMSNVPPTMAHVTNGATFHPYQQQSPSHQTMMANQFQSPYGQQMMQQQSLTSPMDYHNSYHSPQPPQQQQQQQQQQQSYMNLPPQHPITSVTNDESAFKRPRHDSYQPYMAQMVDSGSNYSNTVANGSYPYSNGHQQQMQSSYPAAAAASSSYYSMPSLPPYLPASSSSVTSATVASPAIAVPAQSPPQSQQMSSPPPVMAMAAHSNSTYQQGDEEDDEEEAAPPVAAAKSKKTKGRGNAGADSDSIVQAGPGTALGDIPLLFKRFEKVSNEDHRTKLLFTVCFPNWSGPLPERTAKKTLRLFSGYASDDLRTAGLNKLTEYSHDLELLRKTSRLLDLQVEGDASVHIESIINYLSQPHTIIHPPKEELPTQPTEPKKRKPKEPKPIKRPPNPYLLFATDHREEVTAASPGVPMMEVNRLLGQLWSRADEQTKLKYTKQAEEAKQAWEREHPDLVKVSTAGQKRKREGVDGSSSSYGAAAAAGGSGGLDDSYAAMSDDESEMSDVIRPATPVTSSPHMYGNSSHPSSSASSATPTMAVIDQTQMGTNGESNKFSIRLPKSTSSQPRDVAAGESDSIVRAGPGASLGDIPLLSKRFEKVSNEDHRTKLLFTVCFPNWSGPLPDRTAKKTLRLFSGYASEELRTAGLNKLNEYSHDLELLRKTSRLLDLQVEGDASVHIESIINYLSQPHTIIHPPKEELPSQPSEPKKRKPKEPKSIKRPPNPYLLFATDHREEVTAASPGVPMMEVNRLLGQLWSRADEQTKLKYTKQAEEAKIAWEKEHPELVKGAAGLKRKLETPGGMDEPPLSDQESEMSDVRHPRVGTPMGAPASGGSSSQLSSSTPTPQIIDHELQRQLANSIHRILANADLNKFSLRQVKSALSQEFSEKVVTHNQQLISRLVDQELIAMP